MEQKPTEEKLLTEFEPTTDEQWLAAAEKLLKGKPFDKILRTSTYEGIRLEPQYRREVWDRIAQLEELPGGGSYLRSTKAEGYQAELWKIAQEIDCAEPEELNKALLNALKRGQNAVNIVLDAASISGQDADTASKGTVGRGGTSISCLSDLEKALKDVHLDCVDINIQAYNEGLEYASLLAAYCEKHDIDIKSIKGCVGADPLGHLAENGKLIGGLETGFGKMAGLTLWAKETGAQLRTIDIHTQAYHNAGASAVEELAFALATAVEYIRRLGDFDLEIEDIAPRIQFNLALGGNMYMEISKFRAARQLWSMIVDSYGGNEESAKLYIHARTGKYNKTKNDPYVNMLRTTTEAFAGIIGGVDSMHIGCFDEVIRSSNEFSRRIARNQQIILSEESHLGHVIDPAGGSWYIEELTHKLVERVWETFKLIESEGSMSELLISGKAQDIVKKVSAFRQKNLAKRKDVLVGINMYANLTETALESREPDYIELQDKRSAELRSIRPEAIEIEACAHSIKDAWLAGATLGMISSQLHTDEIQEIPTFSQQRLAEPFEDLRKKMEDHKAKTGRAARVFLANNGGVKQYKARADFSRGFFEVAGFNVIEQGSYQTPSEAGKAAIDSQAEIVVICSTDPTYPEIVPQICQIVKEAKSQVMLVLAGYPKDQIDAHKKSGIDEFIHVRADALSILTEAQKRAGVE